MKFTKMHGLGNDFLVIDARRLPDVDFAALARRLCHRHTGVGADGLLLVLESGVADVRMRIVNSDGSEAEMCGNGIRCFAKYVYERGIVNESAFSVETLAGIMRPELLLEDGRVSQVRVDMGEPALSCADIPVLGEGRCIERALDVGGRTLAVTSVRVGGRRRTWRGSARRSSATARSRSARTWTLCSASTGARWRCARGSGAVAVRSPAAPAHAVWRWRAR